MSNYPLCEKAGLTIYEGDGYIDDNIKADDVEHYLRNLGKHQPNLGDKEQDVKQPEMTYKAHMEWAAKQFDEPKEHDVELGELEFTEKDLVALFGERSKENITRILNTVLREKLSRAPVVYCSPNSGQLAEWTTYTNSGIPDTHTARLVAITPIAKADTADEFLRDLAEYASNQHTLTDLTARARALLAKGGE